MSGRLRLADLLGGLSMAADRGFGLPPEESMRSCVVSTALARKLGAGERMVSDTFYTSLLLHVGCIALAHETAKLFPDDRLLMRAVALTNLADPGEWVGTLVADVRRKLPLSRRAPTAVRILSAGSGSGRCTTRGRARWPALSPRAAAAGRPA